ncbi:hypothetical protein RU07_12390 [Agrobacterium tumefaciens]|uniref:Uncharacterized protein n=1 Tax=Agrobacterium tumefaciens TaxID=358 RepID=A0A0D0KY38_AGRTU|nr:hypothetical protein RU07_12390 [Agrobacterium tumefaciens]
MSNTPNLNIPMPDPSADVDDEFYRLQQAWMLVDEALFQLIAAVAGKSNTGHTHAIDQINGLVSALQNKMDANKAFKIGDLADVVGSADAALNYVLAKNNDGKFSFASALSVLGNHDHSIAQVVGLADALNARLLKSGGSMSGILQLGFDYPQLWFGNSQTGTGWRIIKDTAQGSVGALVFQYSTDKWNQSYNSVMFFGPDGRARFINKLEAQSGLYVAGAVEFGAELYLQAALEIGNTNGTAGVALIDFHTSATVRDYNCRIICDSNANDGNGLGTMNILAGNLMWNGNRLISMWDRATAADIAAGTANKFPDAAAVKVALAAQVPFTSGQQTITNGGQLVIAHGLGSVPGNVSIQLVCVAADKGYNVGDIAFYPPMLVGFNGNAYGMTPVIDATNITLRISTAGFAAQNKTNGNADVLNSANWRLVVKAYP